MIFLGLLGLKKRSTQNKTPWERFSKGDRLKSLQMLRYRSWPSSIQLRDILQQRINGDLSSKIYSVSFAEPLNISVPFLEPIDKNKFIRPNLR